MQRPVVGDLERRVKPDAPPGLNGSATEVNVLVIEEERFVESTQLAEAVAADEKAAAGHPVHRLARRLGAVSTLPARARTEQARKRSLQGRECPTRGLRGAVAIPEPKANHTRAGVGDREFLHERRHVVEEPILNSDIGIQEQDPVTGGSNGEALARAASTAVSRTRLVRISAAREAKIAAESADGHALKFH